MTMVKKLFDDWLEHRLNVPGVTSTLGSGDDTSLFNGIAPEPHAGAIIYPILAFWNAGVKITAPLGLISDGGVAQYHIHAFNNQPDEASLDPILAAVEAQLVGTDGNGIEEVWQGWHYVVVAKEVEMGELKSTEGGLVYAEAGARWLLDVGPV